MQVNGTQAASDIKFFMDYSKYDEKRETKESFKDSLGRVEGMHRFKYEKKMTNELSKHIDFAFNAYNTKLLLGSQRALQFGGEPILRHESRMYNCLTTYVDREEVFRESFYQLLCGCGVGLSVQKQHIKLLPKLSSRSKDAKVFVVPDTIEGWADALGVLISSFVSPGQKADFPEYQGHHIAFDFSKIRPKGAFISGGFKAPGSDGLRMSLAKIEELLDSKIGRKTNMKFNSLLAYDIICHASDAVLSGGLRRSALIILFSKTDKDMLNAKTGFWHAENPQRARSNNSVMLLRNKTTLEEFLEIIESVKQSGEPGFIWTNDLEVLYNPCVEIGMYPRSRSGKSGWQGCNLTEINGGKCETKELFFEACKASAILGTLQAGYTNFKYVGKHNKEIFEQEALLGCSVTGWTNNPDVLFDEEVQREGARIVLEWNVIIADLIGINHAARATCCKPSGNASVLLQTASGIHGEHAERYFRSMQVNKESEIAQAFAALNPLATEESVWSAAKTDYVISVPVIAKPGSLLKKDLMGVEQLKLVKLTQQNWVEYGTRHESCVNKNARHNVSNTIQVEDWDEVGRYIFENRDYFAGVSLLAASGDKDYVQAPFCEVLTAQDLLDKYGTASMFAGGLVVDALHAFDNLWQACDTFTGVGMSKVDLSVETSQNCLQRDLVRRVGKFADKYSQGDITLVTYMLKDVYNLHRWEGIVREWKGIDWDTFDFQPSYVDVDTTGSAACAGGMCEF